MEQAIELKIAKLKFFYTQKLYEKVVTHKIRHCIFSRLPISF